MARTRRASPGGLGLPGRPLRPFPVPIRVLRGVGAPDVSAEVATFFFLDERGEIAKVLETAPIENGVALYNDEPLPRGARWAITVHDRGGLPLFRSGPLAELPGPAGSPRVTQSISVLRSAGASFGLNSPDGAPELVLARLQRIPHPIHVERVRLGADGSGHELVTVEGHTEPVPLLRERFAYTLTLTVRPETAPGRASDILVVERDGPGRSAGADVGVLAGVLDAAIVEGVKEALEAAIRQIAAVELERAGADFRESVVSATSVELTPYVSDASISVVGHPGAVTGGIGPLSSAVLGAAVEP